MSSDGTVITGIPSKENTQSVKVSPVTTSTNAIGNRIKDICERYENDVQVVEEMPSDIEQWTDKQIKELKPVLPKRSQTIAAYINSSRTFQGLLSLNVDLSKVETDLDTTNKLLRLDWEMDVVPYLSWFADVGIDENNIGSILTKAPSLLLEPFGSLDSRIAYLKSKKFDKSAISTIITKCPVILYTPTKEIDTQLGFLQNEFALTGSEVRQVITKSPRIALSNKMQIHFNRIHLTDVMRFHAVEAKQILLNCPRLYIENIKITERNFDYVCNTMGVSHAHITTWPDILKANSYKIKCRHKFLKHIGRDQFDPKLENYISMKALSVGPDDVFCLNVAKVPVSEYNIFLKSM